MPSAYCLLVCTVSFGKSRNRFARLKAKVVVVAAGGHPKVKASSLLSLSSSSDWELSELSGGLPARKTLPNSFWSGFGESRPTSVQSGRASVFSFLIRGVAERLDKAFRISAILKTALCPRSQWWGLLSQREQCARATINDHEPMLLYCVFGSLMLIDFI